MLSIIIPVHNQHDMTHECVYAILENTQDCEIVIIDNGSDPPYKPPFSGFIEARVIRNEENQGFPAAINQGLREARGDVVCLLNNDVIITPGWATTLTAWLESLDIVGPMTNYCAGIQQIDLPAYMNTEDLFKEAGALSQECEGMATETTFIIGFCMFFRRSLFDELGEFDATLWPCSGEEIDFCLRARVAGKKVGVAHDVYVHHFGSQTFEAMEKAGQINYADTCRRNDEHLAERWGADFWQKQVIEQEDENEEK